MQYEDSIIIRNKFSFEDTMSEKDIATSRLVYENFNNLNRPSHASIFNYVQKNKESRR